MAAAATAAAVARVGRLMPDKEEKAGETADEGLAGQWAAAAAESCTPAASEAVPPAAPVGGMRAATAAAPAAAAASEAESSFAHVSS